jgi:bifunctional non-homologous end joining protein LigD
LASSKEQRTNHENPAQATADGRLGIYNAKRDARMTNEPLGPEPLSSAAATHEGSFVVHLHLATRTHYDLRMEVGGALKSFAVPRGPSLDPRDRRLAIETEDHPIEYLEYEGVIPKGNYGAGPMVLWDTGRVCYLERSAEEGLARGKLDFVLAGHKLRGRFALVLSHAEGDPKPNQKRQWLLLKKQDPFARTDGWTIEDYPRSVLSGLAADELQARDTTAEVEALALGYGAERATVEARGMQPMLCAELPRTTQAETDELLNRSGWLYELKLDGVRVLVDKQQDDVALWSRRGPAVTQNYPEIARAVRALPGARLLLDGEIVTVDAAGRPSFSRLAKRIHARPGDVWQLAREVPTTYVAFDLLAVGDVDLRGLPLTHRKELLAKVIRGPGFIRALDHFTSGGRLLFDFCLQQHLEGIVAKRADSIYRPGPRRTGDWIKLKCHRDAEFVVVGLTHGEGSRSELGALDVASYRGGELIVRGKVGSGLDQNAIAVLLDKTKGHERHTCAAAGRLEPAPNGRRFVEPLTVVSIRFGGWTDDGRLRFPVFQGIREDIEPQACICAPRSETLATTATAGDAEPSASNVQSGEAAPRAAAPSVAPVEQVREATRRVIITRPRKVYWPQLGITKGQLVEYYEQVADTLLPYLRDRPVILVRYPDGIEGKHFYQWNVPQGLPSWVTTLALPPENGQGYPRQGFLINDLDTLRYVVNLGCIPIHILASRAQSLQSCDFITLDLDVDALSLLAGIALARSLREIIESAGLRAFPKTSGQTGIHLLVPLGPGVPYEAARLLVELLGRLVAQQHPSTATMERRRDRRGPKVYIDTGQTGPSRAIVAPYSVRAVPLATVSTPLTWDEVTPALDVTRFTLVSVPHRLKTHPDPMSKVLTEQPDILRALSSLESVVRGSFAGSTEPRETDG